MSVYRAGRLWLAFWQGFQVAIFKAEPTVSQLETLATSLA